MADTVTAPTVEPTASEAPAPVAKAPLTAGEKITKALAKDLTGTTHLAFIDWVSGNGGPTLDATSVLATQSLYNVFRQTEEFKTAKDALPKGGGGATEAPMPTTPEEAKAMLEKHAKDQERRQAAQARADARAQKIQELLAGMAGGEAGDATDEATDVAETDEELQEAF